MLMSSAAAVLLGAALFSRLGLPVLMLTTLAICAGLGVAGGSGAMDVGSAVVMAVALPALLQLGYFLGALVVADQLPEDAREPAAARADAGLVAVPVARR